MKSGGPPKDGIPSIDNPSFISQKEAETWINASEPVIAFKHEETAKAYPLQILIWHEIVNDWKRFGPFRPCNFRCYAGHKLFQFC